MKLYFNTLILIWLLEFDLNVSRIWRERGVISTLKTFSMNNRNSSLILGPPRRVGREVQGGGNGIGREME